MRLQGVGTCIYSVLGSVMVFRLPTGLVAEVVVPFGLAKAGLFSRCPVGSLLGIVAVLLEYYYVPVHNVLYRVKPGTQKYSDTVIV